MKDFWLTRNQHHNGTESKGRSRAPLSMAGILGVALFLCQALPGCARDVAASGRTPLSGPGDPTMESSDCPLLPSVPGGLPVPVPPAAGLDSGPDPRTPAAVGDTVRRGTSTYSGMAMIPAGPFDMGSSDDEGNPDERPLHRVNLRRFHIAERQVTVAEYCEFLNKTGLNSHHGTPRVLLEAVDCPVIRKGKTFHPKGGLGDRPMVCVSWHGAADFAKWTGGRLPTVAEWEKAAAVLGLLKPQTGDAGKRPLDSQPPGARGESRDTAAYDGNVWEWCSDWYASDYYGSSPAEDPTGPSTGQERELRGWSAVHAEGARRIQNRHRAFPDGCFRTVGFRNVKD